MGKRLVGSKFWANFGSLPDLGKIITIVSFQVDEKYGNKFLTQLSTIDGPQKLTHIPYKARINSYTNYRTLAEERKGAFICKKH